MRRIAGFLLTPLFIFALHAPLRADEISDWNQNMLQAALTANTTPLASSRVAAIVQSAVFDAVNGVERRYTPIHVQPNAPAGASTRAAAVQAAYGTLVKLFPTQKPVLDVKLAASLAGIASGGAAESSISIERGIGWGQTVASEILLWRSTDGIISTPPPYLGGTPVGQWRPTPPGFQPGSGVQFSSMTPWVIATPNQFRPAGPPAVTSSPYASDYLETKTMGELTSLTRTADQTLYSSFWNSASVTYFFNRVALSLAEEHRVPFSDESRLLGLMNVAIADAGIGCWEAKYYYSFWRPVSAIRLGDADGNVATIGDPSWTPLLVTPGFPDYPSGHSCFSSAASRVLSNYFGENTPFIVDSDSPAMTGVTRLFQNFSMALDEIKNARVFAGIHFRTATDDGQELGTDVADYVLGHALLPLKGNGETSIEH